MSKRKLSHQCPICFEDKHSDEIHITSCGHVFCKLCLEQSLKRSTRCPVCRSYVFDKINPCSSLLEINMDQDLLKDTEKRVAWIQSLCRRHRHKRTKFEIVCQQMIMKKETDNLLSKHEQKESGNFEGSHVFHDDGVFFQLSPNVFEQMDRYTRFAGLKIFSGELTNCSWKSEKGCRYVKCHFTRVVFTGIMVNSLFVNCTFSDCAFRECAFIGDKCGFSPECEFDRGTRIIDCETETPLSWKKKSMANNEKEFARLMQLRGLSPKVPLLNSFASGRCNVPRK